MRRKKFTLSYRRDRASFALIATLALIAVATILLVLFVTASSLDRTASYSYSQSVRADEIGLGGLHLVVGQLQAEMSKDGLPDTNYTGNATYYAPIYTNIPSADIIPQANVTNASLQTMVKMSTNGMPFYTGTLSTSTLQASTISTATPSINGRSVGTNVWNGAYFGQFPNSASTPYWVLMTRGGPSSGSALTFGTAGSTVNNPDPANNNYTLGRIAYAVYDESGLLDVTAAGYDTTSFAANENAISLIKGTLAGADLTQVGIPSPSTFVQWRNAMTAASTNSYIAYVTNFASTNGFRQVAAGDSTFLGRQDLIEAALNGTGGLTPSVLTNLTTFTREVNAPSWAPSVAYVSATTKYKYTANALTLTTPTFSASVHSQNPNPFIPIVRYKIAGTITGYRSDGTTYQYTVNVGDPVVQQRFPLDRLNWVTPKGPSALLATSDAFYNPGGTVASIRACFGLVWGPAENKSGDANWTVDGTVTGTGVNLWKYYGSSLTPTIPTAETSTGISPVSTLVDVAGGTSGAGVETVARAPNFFELLQAGVLSGSLGVTFGAVTQFGGMTSTDQNLLPLQFLRIGASAISQVQPQAYPINIEYNFSGASAVASGIANLPYINLLKFVGGLSPDDPDQTNPSTTGGHQIGLYGLVGLWNPHQRSGATLTRPPIRLYIQGEIDSVSAWATTASPQTTIVAGASPQPAYPQPGNGLKTILPANNYWVQLVSSSSAGAGGFQNPYGVTSSDVASQDTHSGSSTVAGWTAAPTSMSTTGDIDAGVTYEAFRLPDLLVNFNLTGAAIPGNGTGGLGPNSPAFGLSKVGIDLGGITSVTATANPFQMILKYQDPSGNWVPYDFFDGINNHSTWMSDFGLVATQMPVTASATAVTSPYPLPTLQATLHPTSSAMHGSAMIMGDPRCLKFGPTILVSDAPATGQAQAGYGLVNDPVVDSIWSGYNTLHAVKVLSPFDLSGYGGNGSGSPATPGLPPNAEMNAVPTFLANYYFPAYLPRNNTAYPNVAGTGPGSYFTAYTDTDGIQRIGDSGLFPTTVSATFIGSTGNPYYDPNDLPNTAAPRTSDRPVILNRPFASVGELGYVFRDDPWRSLDFFSVFNNISTTGDSGLLDLFCVTDTVNPVVAGRVNLNTKNSLVLQAVLNNTLADPVGGSLAVSSTALAAIPSALTTFTAATPLVNKDWLVTQFNPKLTAASFGSTDEQSVKAYREAYIRALADVGQTRTWNLMIDLIAQSGKYPPTATSLDQFEVDGERHYWLHIAIDRVTGKIVDRQLELIGP